MRRCKLILMYTSQHISVTHLDNDHWQSQLQTLGIKRQVPWGSHVDNVCKLICEVTQSTKGRLFQKKRRTPLYHGHCQIMLCHTIWSVTVSAIVSDKILLKAFQTVTMCPHWEHPNMLKLQCIGRNDDENPYYFAQYCPTKQNNARGRPNFDFKIKLKICDRAEVSCQIKVQYLASTSSIKNRPHLHTRVNSWRQQLQELWRKKLDQTFKDQIVVSYSLLQPVLLHPSQCSYMVLRQCKAHQNFVWRTSSEKRSMVLHDDSQVVHTCKTAETIFGRIINIGMKIFVSIINGH